MSLAFGGSQAWIVAPIKTAATSLAGRSGLRGRGTLEERGPNVGFRWKNVVGVWVVRDECFDRHDEEEEGDEEEESGGVMIGCVGEEKKQDGDQGREESERFPSANCWRADHL
jgi:hypothetical protein